MIVRLNRALSMSPFPLRLPYKKGRSACHRVSGVSIKAGYRRSTAVYRTSYRRLIGCPERWKLHFRASRFQIFLGGGGMPPDPPRGRGPCGPFSGHRCLLHLQWPLVTNVIETPGVFSLKRSSMGAFRVPSRVLS